MGLGLGLGIMVRVGVRPLPEEGPSLMTAEVWERLVVWITALMLTYCGLGEGGQWLRGRGR